VANNLNLFDGMVLFTQVVNSGGFTAAALVNNHSTSYISKEINKLESRLGTRLLNRTTRKISLTAEGEAFFKQCEQMIIDAEQALGILNQTNMAPRGLLKISCPVGFGMSYLGKVFSQYATLYPEVQLDLDLSDRRVDIVQDGYDLAIRATDQLNDSSLVCKKFSSFKLKTVASHGYIKKYGMPKSPEDLINHHCISYRNAKTPTKWEYETLTGNRISVDVPPTILCNNAEMEVMFILEDRGICRLPEFYLQKELEQGKLVVLFEDYKEKDIDIYALYPSKKHLSAKVRKFIDLLTEHI